jgi:hypothetical protein
VKLPPFAKSTILLFSSLISTVSLANQHLASGIGHWHPHMMIFAPYYENSMLGNNEFGSPLPQLSDDAGTPFAVVVIPVDDKLAIKSSLVTPGS